MWPVKPTTASTSSAEAAQPQPDPLAVSAMFLSYSFEEFGSQRVVVFAASVWRFPHAEAGGL